MAGDYRALRRYVRASQALRGLDNSEADRPILLAALRKRTDGLPVLKESELLGRLGPDAQGKLLAWNNLALVLADVKAQNRTGLGMWANALYGAEMIAEAEKDAILQYLAATSPGTGPMLSETVPGWNQAVTADDLASEKYAEAGAS